MDFYQMYLDINNDVYNFVPMAQDEFNQKNSNFINLLSEYINPQNFRIFINQNNSNNMIVQCEQNCEFFFDFNRIAFKIRINQECYHKQSFEISELDDIKRYLDLITDEQRIIEFVNKYKNFIHFSI